MWAGRLVLTATIGPGLSTPTRRIFGAPVVSRAMGFRRASAGSESPNHQEEPSVPTVTMRELLEAGVHFGHQTRRWNPKMRRFIFGERGGIYIIDLQKTERLLQNAQEFAGQLAGRGGTVLFVGTKKQARDAIREAAEACGMPYVNQRWLG